MASFVASVVEVRTSAETKAVRFGHLKVAEPLVPEHVWIVIKAELLKVTVVRVPVRPVIDVSKILKDPPSILWIISC